jgi:transketolase
LSTSTHSLDTLCINTIRTLSIDAVQKANSGHPGLPLGAAPMAYVLWQRFLKHNPHNPHWPDRDRFVLSAGHGSMLLYSLFHLTGYDLTLDDLKAFRQWGSRTPGHPEYGLTPGVEATTGPLGQGTANAVGMAIAERFLANRYNRDGHEIVNHRTFCLVGDGDMMEGISSEAGSLAGHLKLGKLVYLYDDNKVSLDGPTSQSFTEDVLARYAAYGWKTLRVEDGNTDIAGIQRAIAEAVAQTEKPTIIAVRTTIGYGSPHKAGTSAAHGSPLGVEEVALTKKALGWEWTEPFYQPPEAVKHLRTAVERGARAESEWQKRFDAWAKAYPDRAEEWRLAQAGELPAGWDADMPQWKAGESLATRLAGGKSNNQIPKFRGFSAATRISRSLPRRRSRAQALSTARPEPGTTSTTACASTPWRRSATGFPTTPARVPSWRPSSASPTTCARRSGSPRSRSSRRSSSGRTTRSASGKTGRPTRRSSN